MVIIGCDYHRSGQQVFGIDTESGEVAAERWIAHTCTPWCGQIVDRAVVVIDG